MSMATLTKTQVKTKELAVTGEGAKIDSMVCHTVDHEHYEDLFPRHGDIQKQPWRHCFHVLRHAESQL